MKKFFLAFIIFSFCSTVLFSQTIESNGTGGGDWDDTNTWVGGTIPTSSNSSLIQINEDDVVNIPDGYTATVDEVYIDLFGEIIVDDGGTLDLVDGTGDDLQIFNDDIDNGFLTIDGRFILNQGATAVEDDNGPPGGSPIGSLSDLTTTVGSTGIFELAYTTTAGEIIGASWVSGSTVQVTGYTSNSTPPTGLDQNFHHFTWNCTSQTANVDLNGALTAINGNLTVSSTGGGSRSLRMTNSTGSVTFNIGVNLIIENDVRFVAWGSATSVTYNITGDLNYSTTGTCSFGSSGTGTVNIAGDMNVSNSSGTLRAATTSGDTTFDIDGDLSFTSGTIDSDNGVSDPGATFLFTGSGVQNFTGGGTFSDIINFEIASTSTLNLGTGNLHGDGDFLLNAGGTLRVGSANGLVTGTASGNIRVLGTRTYTAAGNIVYNGSVAQDLGNEWSSTGDLDGVDVNLEIDNSDGVTNNNSGTTSIGGVLTLTTGTLNIGSASTLDVQGVFNGDGGSFGVAITSNLTFSGTGAMTGTLDFATADMNNLTINRSGTATLGTNLDINGTLSFASTGNLDISGQTLTIESENGDITQSGSGGLISNSSSNLVLSGTGALTAIPYSGAGNQLNNLTFNRTASATYTWNTSITVNGTLNLNSGTLTHSSGLNMFTGSIFSRSAGTISAAPTATTTYNVSYASAVTTGPELPTVAADDLNNLTIGGGNVTLDKAIIINGVLSMTSGIFNASTFNIEMNGSNFTANGGAFATGAGHTITFSGNTTLGGSSIDGAQFVDLTIAASSTMIGPSANINVSGTWNNSGTFTAGSSTITFNGANQNIDAAGQSFNNVVFAGTLTKTLLRALDVNGTLTINSTLNVGANYAINVAGSWINTGTYTPGIGTVTFDGAGQTITSNSQPFFNLTLATGGTKTLGDALDLNGTLTINSSVTLDASPSAYSINLAGNWINNGTDFNARTGTVTFDGTTTVSGSTTTDFHHLTIAGSLIAPSGNLDATGNWLYSSGSFTHGGGTVRLNGGTSQNITSGSQSFNDLTLTGSGSKILQDALDVNGDLDFSSTLDVGSNNPINVAGNWTNNSGNFTAGSGKVTFDGGGTLDINGAGVTVFNDLDVTGSTNVEIETTQSVAGTLALIGASSSFDADGSGGLGDFTLVSTDDNPATDGNIAALTTPANFTGNVTVERYISSGTSRWRYIGSPVSGLTIADWQGEFPISGDFTGTDNGSFGIPSNAFPSLYYYDAGAEAWQQYPVNQPGDDNTGNIVTGVGYSAWIRDNVGPFTDNVVSQEGPINKGNWDFTQAGQGNLQSSTSGWNLLANPYPAALDWNALYDDASTGGVDGVMTVPDNSSGSTVQRGWDAENDIDVNSGTKNIAIGQSFWVNSTSSPTLTATESMKTTDSHNFYKLSTPTNYMRIALSQNGVSDETLIFFYEDALPGMDKHDSHKRDNGIFNLATLNANEDNMVVNAVGAMDCKSTVQLNFYYNGPDPNNPGQNTDKVVPGNYQLIFTEFESFTQEVEIVLFDKFDNSSTDITSSTTYGFEVSTDEASFGTDRFEITFDFAGFNLNVDVTNDATVCDGENANVFVDNSATGVKYKLSIDGVAITDIIEGNGGQIGFDIASNLLEEGPNSIQLVAENSTCGEGIVSSNILIDKTARYEVASVTDGNSCDTTQGVILQATGAPNDGLYRWYASIDDTGPIKTTTSGEFTTPVLTATTTYYVTASSLSGCESLERVEVHANVETLYNVENATDQNVCPQSIATLTVEGAPTNGSYIWYDSAGNEIPGENGATYVTPVLSSSTSFQAAVVNSIGCEGIKSSILVTVSSKAMEIDATSDGYTCGPGSVTLIASGTPAAGTYQWYDPDRNAINGATGAEFVVKNLTASATYAVQSISSLNCTSARFEIEAEYRDGIEKPVIQRDGDLLFVEMEADDYQWYRNDEMVSGEQGNSLLIGSDSHEYTIEVGINGCSAISEPLLVLGISDQLSQNVAIYPNPASEKVNIEFDQSEAEEMDLYILDINGKIVYTKKLIKGAQGFNFVLDIKKYVNGVYFVKLSDGKRIFTGKFVKE